MLEAWAWRGWDRTETQCKEVLVGPDTLQGSAYVSWKVSFGTSTSFYVHIRINPYIFQISLVTCEWQVTKATLGFCHLHTLNQ